MANHTHSNKYGRDRVAIILLIVLMSQFPIVPPRALSADQKPQKTEKTSKPKSPKKKGPDRDATEVKSLKIGAGGGIQSVYIPSVGLEVFGSFASAHLGIEYGFFKFSQGSFVGQTSYFGLSGRWILNQKRPLFFGLSLGSRNIQVATVANMNFTDANNGDTTETPVTWTRNVSQLIVCPKAGWIWEKNRSAALLGLGLTVPMSSKSSISGSPDSVPGVSDDAYQATANEKLTDVTSKTNMILPAIEFKYLLFFH